jgi:ribonuclease D
VKQALAAAEVAIFNETPAQLEQAAASWQGAKALGIDTEFVRERTYRAALGLVQVSDGETAWLIDPLSTGNMAPLLELLKDPGIEKVIHSGSEDFEVLYHHLGGLTRGVVDSQIACAMLGQSLQLGYHNAVNWLFEVEVEKDLTRSNWLRRPLSPGQLRYAALDVVLLPMMMDRLRDELERLGRWAWLKEEVERVQRKSVSDVEPAEAWMRIGGAGMLNDTRRTALSLLAKWREERALSRNIARGFVISDAILMAMARQIPTSIAELQDIQGLNSKVANRFGEEWLALLQQVDSIPPAPPVPQLSGEQKSWLNAMRSQVSRTAKKLDVDAALLASRKQLERLIHTYSESKQVPDRFTGWRMDVVTHDLLAIMERQG